MRKDVDKKKLAHLLDVTKADDIFDVIGRMEVLNGIFEEYDEYNNLSPFTKTYYYVTKNIAEISITRKDVFEDFKKIQKLDICFASFYFNPLQNYLLKREKTTPWKTFFEYCSKRKGIAFLQMFLGINAHVNGDLALSMLKARTESRVDFEYINTVLRETIPEVMRNLAFHERDPFGAGALMLRDFVETEFHEVIARWRDDAWENYQILKQNKDRKLSQKIIKGMFKKTEAVAQELIGFFSTTSLNNLMNISNNLKTLEVRLEEKL